MNKHLLNKINTFMRQRSCMLSVLKWTLILVSEDKHYFINEHIKVFYKHNVQRTLLFKWKKVVTITSVCSNLCMQLPPSSYQLLVLQYNHAIVVILNLSFLFSVGFSFLFEFVFCFLFLFLFLFLFTLLHRDC